MNDSDQARRKAAGFRPGQDQAGMPPPPAAAAVRPPPPGELGFTAAADAGGTDLDVLMGYQIFLGRDPENSFVIADAKSSPVRAFLRALMGSGEFQSGVLDPLMAGRPLPHERFSAGPPEEQRHWLLRFLNLDAIGQAGLRDATGWRDFLRVLVALPGFPGNARSAEVAPSGVAAEAASRGFVLINIDQPKPGEPVHPGSRITGSGWAIAPADVSEVAIFIDGNLLTHASYGLPRPDVVRGFPHYRHVDHCGFTFAAEVPGDLVLTPESQLIVVVRTGLGDVGRKGVRIGKQTEAAAGSADRATPSWPIRVFVEDAAVNASGVLRLRGWAVAELSLESVSVHLGEMDLGVADAGLPRPDIARDFPSYPNAAHSGFALMRRLTEWQPGPGYIRVQVRDEAGRQRQAIVPVVLPPPGAAGAGHTQSGLDDEDWAVASHGPDGIVLCCDVASLGADGSVQLSGWALADSGVSGISVSLDGTPLGEAAVGGARADLQQRFPDNPQAVKAGFTFRHQGRLPPGRSAAVGDRLSPGNEPSGTHEVGLLVRSRLGDQHAIVLWLTPEAFDLRSGRDADMRLEIDRPFLDGDVAIAAVRGALTISGWTVARGGVDHVAVLCDGTLLGRAYLGMRREDIGAAFPDFEGAQLSGFALVLPPGALPSGTHRITVAAYAREAAGETMRVFSLTVEEDAAHPGGTIRGAMPAAEASFGLRLLESREPAYRPLFEVLIRSDGAASADLLKTLGSLARQEYGRWNAVVPVADRNAASALARAAAGLPGWSDACAANLRPVQPGVFWRQNFTDQPDELLVICLREGDELGCDALLELAIGRTIDPEAGLLYADELRLDPGLGRRRVWAKPGFSPEMMLATNYIGRSWCAAAGVLNAAGISRGDLLVDCDYTTVLRLTETAGEVAHVNRVLFDRNDALVDTPAQEQAALVAALLRRDIAGCITAAPAPGTWRIERSGAAGRSSPGRVSIIIPTCGARGLVRRAIATIRATTAPAVADGRIAEIVIVDNIPPRERALRTWLRRAADVVVDAPGAFNWSRFNNLGAAKATGDLLLFLNDDIEATEAGWLEALIEHALEDAVGVVGARLLYPDGKVQHAGQYLADGHARHAFRFADAASSGPFGLAAVTREVMSVTGACMMTSRVVFDRLGGFDEAHSVVNNDLDYCLRAWRDGLAVIYTPHATLIHHELASRAGMADVYDERRFSGAWRERFLAGDPFRNASLRADDDHYGIDAEPCAMLHVGRRGPEIGSIRRILAVKLDHIGDFLTALPALRSLRRRFPMARIELLAPPASAALARSGGEVDEVIEFTFFHVRSGQGQRQVSAAEFEALSARLAERHYDMAIDLRMQPETREALRCSGAKVLVGYDHDNAFPWLDVSLEWEGDLRLAPKRGHISERLVQLVAAAEDACREEHAPDEAGPVDPFDVPCLAALPAGFLERPIVCVHPGVGNVVRQWPAASFAGLIDLLIAEQGVHIVLVGAAEEAPVADEVLRLVAAQGSVESLVGRVKLDELANLMRACVLFVGNNSGPKHLAASLGVPTVGIHSGVVDAAEWGPLGRSAVALRRRMVCGPCYLEFASDCPRGLACLTAIRPRDVMDACIRMLASS